MGRILRHEGEMTGKHAKFLRVIDSCMCDSHIVLILIICFLIVSDHILTDIPSMWHTIGEWVFKGQVINFSPKFLGGIVRGCHHQRCNQSGTS